MISKAEKATYDREYRERNRPLLKAKKAAYFQRTYDPTKAAIERSVKMPKHIEYCRRPEYRKKKSEYDRRKILEGYGEYAECYLLLRQLKVEIRKIQPDRFELYRESGRKQWSIATMIERKRRREESKRSK